jgi:hypothetical protein
MPGKPERQQIRQDRTLHPGIVAGEALAPYLMPSTIWMEMCRGIRLDY